jgi:hypothetical protein
MQRSEAVHPTQRKQEGQRAWHYAKDRKQAFVESNVRRSWRERWAGTSQTQALQAWIRICTFIRKT